MCHISFLHSSTGRRHSFNLAVLMFYEHTQQMKCQLVQFVCFFFLIFIYYMSLLPLCYKWIINSSIQAKNALKFWQTFQVHLTILKLSRLQELHNQTQSTFTRLHTAQASVVPNVKNGLQIQKTSPLEFLNITICF